ncbi:Sugar/inositol transporter [Niveomyces insectorum RCEF 264]|uniref:Sugar/inositol transporter n=1 Tax=Niveomyces insectorum RCEF 264 TaxID=1081102 RepID=A0A167MP07_9HYPO|nr:Sugar/inositol transporter [Niveomyces insectorum RCEF 264]
MASSPDKDPSISKDAHHEHREHLHSKVEAQEAAFAAGEEKVAQLIAQMEQQAAADKSPRAQGLRLSSLVLSNPKHYTWALVAFASMGGLLSGLDQSIISGANLFMPDDLSLTTRQNSLVNSGMPLGAVGGALLLSPCNEYLGRRMAIIVACVLYTIGAALEAGSINFAMMVAARLVLGLGVGLEGGTVPVYVAETVERRLRGNLVSFYQFNIALGEVIGYAVGAMFTSVKGGWRYMLGSSVVFSTIMMVGMFFLPESPRYLLHRGKVLEAYHVWRRLRGVDSYESNREFYLMKVSVEAEEEEVHSSAVHKRFPWLDFFTEPRARRSIVYANIMVFFGQFTGCNAILYYLSVLMNQIGFDKFQSNYMSLVGGGSLLLGTIPAVLYMERFGRRFWAISMLPGFFVGLVLIGVSYLFSTTTQLPAAEGIYLTGLILYYAFFGSYACLTWVIPSEVYPTYLRSYGMTSSDATLFLGAFLMTYNFSAMQDSMTPTGLLVGFYGGIAAVAWVYQILFMPETKGKTLEEIDFIFRKPVSVVVRENITSTQQTVSSLVHLRWREVFTTVPPVQRVDGSLDASALEKQEK